MAGFTFITFSSFLFHDNDFAIFAMIDDFGFHNGAINRKA